MSSFDVEKFQAWAEETVGGLQTSKNEAGEQEWVKVFQLCVPKDSVRCHDYYTNVVFPDMKPLVQIGRKKFSVPNWLNSAETLEMLYEHAELFKTPFIAILDAIVADQSVDYFPKPNQVNFIKPREGLSFKLGWKSPHQINDILRTSIVCPTIDSLVSSVLACRKYFDTHEINYAITNFAENIHRFGELDYTDGKLTGYVGIHFHLVLTLPASTKLDKESSDETIQLMVEIQFQPISIYDGSNNSIKSIVHEAYRAMHNNDAKEAGLLKETRDALELYHAYGLSSFA